KPSLTTAKLSASSPPSTGSAPQTISTPWSSSSSASRKKPTPTPAKAPSTTASQNFPTMENSLKSISPASKPAPASTTTAMKKKAPATSRYGKPPSPASISGIRQSPAAGPAGTSSAPPWP